VCGAASPAGLVEVANFFDAHCVPLLFPSRLRDAVRWIPSLGLERDFGQAVELLGRRALMGKAGGGISGTGSSTSVTVKSTAPSRRGAPRERIPIA
jgi:hypothetical protein